jgi:selenophosphate synthetase-related protein
MKLERILKDGLNRGVCKNIINMNDLIEIMGGETEFQVPIVYARRCTNRR